MTRKKYQQEIDKELLRLGQTQEWSLEKIYNYKEVNVTVKEKKTDCREYLQTKNEEINNNYTHRKQSCDNHGTTQVNIFSITLSYCS